MKRDHWQRRIEQLDPDVDFAEIYRINVRQLREFAIYPGGYTVDRLGTFPQATPSR